ncbi:hypothetical protein H0H93_005015, partial [Arthromyces matolae]
LRNVRVFVLDDSQWRLEITFQDFKGSNETTGQSQIWILNPVKNAHNLIFDVATYIMALLFSRQAFQTKYQ